MLLLLLVLVLLLLVGPLGRGGRSGEAERRRGGSGHPEDDDGVGGLRRAGHGGCEEAFREGRAVHFSLSLRAHARVCVCGTTRPTRREALTGKHPHSALTATKLPRAATPPPRTPPREPRRRASWTGNPIRRGTNAIEARPLVNHGSPPRVQCAPLRRRPRWSDCAARRVVKEAVIAPACHTLANVINVIR